MKNTANQNLPSPTLNPSFLPTGDWQNPQVNGQYSNRSHTKTERKKSHFAFPPLGDQKAAVEEKDDEGDRWY